VMLLAAPMLAIGSVATRARAQQGKVLQLGSIGTLSGPNASMGKEGLAGLQYGVKQINAAGGVKIGADTYTLELVNIDDQSKPELAVAAAEKLINDSRVPVIFGPPASTTTLAILPTAEKAKTLVMTFIAAAPNIVSPEFTYSFRNTINSLHDVNPSVDFLVKTKEVKTIAYLGRNDDWGRSAGKALAARAKELGAQEVVEEYFDPGTTDFYSLLTKVRAVNPDAVMASAIIEDGVPLIKQYRELQMKPLFLCLGVIWASPNFINAAGKAADGAYVATGAQTADTPEIRAFNDAFKQAMGMQSQSFDKTGYDALGIVLQAMKDAGSTDPTKTRDAMRTLTYKGVLQEYKFAGGGQSEVVVNVNQIKDGHITVINSLRTL
jgi:branched-chain amino acid transport system substrate-binding protein